VVPPGEETRESEATVERIERLKPSEMMPDRFQPRRLLPPALREAFFSGKSNCYQTAMDWLTLSRSDPGIHREVEQLLAMGASFDEHGQIKSITGSWQSTPKGDYFFLIEPESAASGQPACSTPRRGSKTNPCCVLKW